MHKDGANIVVEADRAERARAPYARQSGLLRSGFGVASGHGFLCGGGRHDFSHTMVDFLARVEGPVAGNVLLRHDQHLCLNRHYSDDYLSDDAWPERRNPRRASQQLRNISAPGDKHYANVPEFCYALGRRAVR